MNDIYISQTIDWLLSVQNKDDGGWGMYEHHPSRIITTAEAVTALAIAGAQGEPLDRGIGYLLASAARPDWCQYTRHHAWTIYALTRAGCRDEVPSRCIQALQKSQTNGGWSHESRGEPSVFPTFLAWRALNIYGRPKTLPTRACQWIVRNAKGAFWTFADNKQSYAATSYAVITLTSQQNWENNFGRQINESVEFLRTGAKSFWPIEQEHSVSGDFIYNFHHFTLAWTVIAFLSAGVSIFDPLIMRAVDRLYRGHYNLNTGGWSEEENHRPSIFGTSHVLAALEMFYQSLTVGVYLQHLDERNIQMSQDNSTPNHVFIVHGHDNAVKQEVARFLERIGCNPIILEEQVDAGMTTIIQKFSAHASRAAYAIVLLTPDDIAEDGAGKKAGRARQNVVMELGFFIAKLGAEHVCLAKKGDVEIPSDIAGALYLNLDDGGWQLSLARKLKSAGLTIDLSKLV